MSWPPERAGGGGATVMALLDLDGGDELISVAALKEGVPSLDIWDLRDHEAEIWALRCRVEVTVPRLYDGISKHRILSVGGGAILIGDSSCCTTYDLEDIAKSGTKPSPISDWACAFKSPRQATKILISRQA
ncbi:unnamed protein product [Urochloa humidicola]